LSFAVRPSSLVSADSAPRISSCKTEIDPYIPGIYPVAHSTGWGGYRITFPNRSEHDSPVMSKHIISLYLLQKVYHTL